MRLKPILLAGAFALGLSPLAHAQGPAAGGPVAVAFAGSMGTVMNDGVGPAFQKQTGAAFHGTGQGAFALARLIAARKLSADAFVAITPGPIELLQKAGLVDRAVPVASTQMVIAYEPGSRFGKELAAAAAGKRPWWKVLEQKGVRFGRTDPDTDPQGQAIILTMKLAALYYHQPGLDARILGPVVNPAQIMAEPSLLARLQAGQLDAASGYLSAVRSLHLPYITLPAEINLSDPTLQASWYDKVSFALPATTSGAAPKVVKVQPLVFYAAVPKDAPDQALGRKFVAFLQSSEGQALMHRFGYGPPKGGAI